jgi:hypothetical protein
MKALRFVEGRLGVSDCLVPGHAMARAAQPGVLKILLSNT